MLHDAQLTVLLQGRTSDTRRRADGWRAALDEVPVFSQVGALHVKLEIWDPLQYTCFLSHLLFSLVVIVFSQTRCSRKAERVQMRSGKIEMLVFQLVAVHSHFQATA